jgi:3-hydroxyacyl-[acyl-carrier-protein] dehydratase
LQTALATDKKPRSTAQQGTARTRLKFNLIDKVERASADRLVGVKHVSLAEEYLADHFPSFPVLPGVMMLEAAIQAAGWVLHLRHDFAKSMAVLKEARNVKYGRFVAPGGFLKMDVELIKPTDAGASFKATGSVAGASAMTARIELAYFNLSDSQPKLADFDRQLIEYNRRRWALIAPEHSAAAPDAEPSAVTV